MSKRCFGASKGPLVFLSLTVLYRRSDMAGLTDSFHQDGKVLLKQQKKSCHDAFTSQAKSVVYAEPDSKIFPCS